MGNNNISLKDFNPIDYYNNIKNNLLNHMYKFIDNYHQSVISDEYNVNKFITILENEANNYLNENSVRMTARCHNILIDGSIIHFSIDLK